MADRSRVFARLVSLVVFAALASFGAAGCGGGDGNGSGNPNNPAAPNTVSVGPITGFGSVYVNDVRWDIAAASVEFDGVAGIDDDLRAGMLVKVGGTSVGGVGATTATATTIEFDDTVEGPISGAPTVISPGIVSFVVLGLTIVVEDGVTHFDGGATLAGLSAGDYVEVSGAPDQTGAIAATYLRAVASGPARVELRGTVSALMRNLSQFTLGAVTVQYDGNFQGTIFRNGLSSPQDLQNGQIVDVLGVWQSANQIDADVIELEDPPLVVQNAATARLRGFVSGLAPMSQFTVSGIAVDGNGASLAPMGFVLANGEFVDVVGTLSNGALDATSITSRALDDEDGDVIEIRAAIPAGGINAFGANTLALLNIEVQTNADTLYADDRDGASPFGFANLAVGDFLVLRGFAAAGNVVVATRVRRDTFGGDVTLRGPVTVLSPPSTISLVGRALAFAPGIAFFDAAGTSVTQGAFFGVVLVDDIVRAVDTGAINAAGLGAVDELSLEIAN